MARDKMDAPNPYRPPEERTSGWDDYELRDGLRTLTAAQKIRRNRPFMAALRKEAKKQLNAAKAAADHLTRSK